MTTESRAMRLDDLGPDDLAAAGVTHDTTMAELQRRLKCKACKWRGRATLSVRWGPR